MGTLPPAATAVATSGAPESSRARAPSAKVACCVAAVGAAIVVALQRAPGHWSDTIPRAHVSDEPGLSALARAWTAMTQALPIGETALRIDLVAAISIVGAAVAAAGCASRLWRGAARGLAVAIAGPLVAVGLAAWAREAGGATVVAVLPTVVLGTLALTLAMRGSSRSRPVAAAMAIALALLDPTNALPFAIAIAGVLAAAWWHARASDRSGRASAGALAGAAAVLVAAIALGGVLGVSWSLPDAAVPSFARLHAHVPRVVGYPSIALLVLLLVPLGWRGGGGLSALAVASFVIAAPASPATLVVAIAIAASGWVWLAGSITSRRGPAAVLGAGATISLVALAIYGTDDLGHEHRTIAVQRPNGTIVRFYERGLVAPGDVLVVHGVRLEEALAREREVAGWRPDVVLLDGRELETSPIALLAWATADRRVTSDRFDGGFEWDPRWVIDSGPVFWLAGPGADAERAFTDLTRFVPDLARRPAQERVAWEVALVERARFRRALGEPEDALAAMPMAPERVEGLTMRLQLAVSARPGAGAQSELPGLTSELQARPGALFAAEAGDLLYAHGEHERAGELLVEAAAGGVRSALPALARWQLRTGEETDGRATLRAVAADPTLRDEALTLSRWLVERGRIEDARALAEAMTPDREHAAEEIVARLGVLRASAVKPSADVAVVPDEVVRSTK